MLRSHFAMPRQLADAIFFRHARLYDERRRHTPLLMLLPLIRFLPAAS